MISSSTFAQNLSNIPGMFLDLGFGARPMGMGGAFLALSDDGNAVFWNPAGLASLKNQYASFTYFRQFDLIPYTVAVYANGLDSTAWAHSEGLIVSGDDALRETTITFGIGRRTDFMNGLQVGLAVNYKNATFGNNTDGGIGQIKGSAIGLSIDFGTLFMVQENIKIGIVAKNIIDFVSWNTSGVGHYMQSSPVQLLGGVALLPNKNLSVCIDLNKSLHQDTYNRLFFGMERRFFDLFCVRGGASQDMIAGGQKGYNLGFGIQYSLLENYTFCFDGAYIIEELQNNLRITVTVIF
jgi:hypothetical protein